MAALLTPAQLEHADTVLGDWLGDRTETALCDAARGIDQPQNKLGFTVTRRLVSTLLRKRGFAAAGVTGTGYDRDTLYRRAGA